MMTRTIYRILIYVLVLLISIAQLSCGDSGPPCGPSKNYIYDIDSMAVNIYDVPDGTLNPSINDTGFSGTNLLFSDLLMVISAQNITYIASATLPDKRPNWLIKSANACSRPIPYTSETIAGISITSNQDYNNALPAGAVLNEILTVNYLSHFLGFPSTLYSAQAIPLTLVEYVSLSPNSVAHLGLRLTEPPNLSLTHTFTITYTHNSGESFTLTTAAITFQ